MEIGPRGLRLGPSSAFHLARARVGSLLRHLLFEVVSWANFGGLCKNLFREALPTTHGAALGHAQRQLLQHDVTLSASSSAVSLTASPQ